MKEVVSEGSPGVRFDERIESIAVPVTDIDRAKEFYAKLGWRLDIDYVAPDGGFRIVQFTPPGSLCSIQIGTNTTSATPGSLQSTLLVVKDIEVAHADIARRGIAIGDVYHVTLGKRPEPGPDPDRRSYSSFADFKDPDGDGWRLQEITQRLPGR
jgi:catechol 2,3-dioxygenase-like lactoylglutathione lyase family enzyme